MKNIYFTIQDNFKMIQNLSDRITEIKSEKVRNLALEKMRKSLNSLRTLENTVVDYLWYEGEDYDVYWYRSSFKRILPKGWTGGLK